MKRIIFLSLLALILHSASAQRRLNLYRRAEQDALNSILTEEYDTRISPGGNDTSNGPTVVTVNIYVRSIDSVDTANNEMNVQLTFRREWVDSRLAFYPPGRNSDLKYLTLHDTSKIWTPDLFFSNEKESKVHGYTKPNAFVRIYPSGEVLQSERVSLTLACPMILKSFPFDTQTCSIRLASFAHTTKDVLITWKKVDPIQVKDSLELPQFTLESFKQDVCDSQTVTGKYSCIKIDFELKREITTYFLHVFIPCTMLVIMSYLTFWLDARTLVARMTLAVTSLALMIFNVTRLNEKIPHVSYTKAIDQWTGISLTFVFFAVIEAVVANYWARSNCGKGPCHGDSVEQAKLMDGETSDVEEGKKGEPKNLKGRVQKRWAELENCGQKLDFMVKFIYPLAFGLFVIIFMLCNYS